MTDSTPSKNPPAAPSEPVPHIAIGVISARNPDGLRETLASLANLVFPADMTPTVSVFVVGLEASGPTAAVAREAGATYLHEPKPGTAVARMHLLKYLPENVQLIAWLDDDSRARPEWLAALLLAQKENDAAIVLGAIEAALPHDAPQWLKNGGFFNRRRYADRANLLEGVNNSLMRVAALQDDALRFAEENFTAGAGDAVFLRRAALRGLGITWTPLAVVTEVIPRGRCTFAWLFGLSFRIGNVMGRSAWRVEGPGMTFKRMFMGLSEAVRGLLFTPLGLFGWHEGARALFEMSFGVGMFLGTLGLRVR